MIIDRDQETVDAVELLRDLGKPVAFIASQVALSELEVRSILKTGRVPRRQLELFDEAGDGED